MFAISKGTHDQQLLRILDRMEDIEEGWFKNSLYDIYIMPSAVFGF